mmetsp:Transcript_16631/g.49747  ORF Transcript_16631/g.49747 Transcript_16631/m.49747 type:complete len:398 (-) Transcript_16631:469-1662(-)|eukprot:CAMPEP_0206139122 /NCGR_PEP_ID=MMETSP1473-20131121/4855_1 /ASSEMBLY_ACC=CAM_ASM_001109 /TAXON_ID=1461547 /ORGANISM="Stichococcus sp, Strain RCC1054" /LENGTH=397 /DNA_ID=CAMNT_0053532773 /DNA_START=310 /DNA_END=1503 /DNA_ORIENTATION=-
MASSKRPLGVGGLASRILHLPAFLLAVFFMYWSVPLGMLLGHIRTLRFSGSRNDAYGWGRALQALFGIKLRQLPGPRLYKGGACIWLCNHRSWADFFVDVLTTQGDSQMLSRMAVALVFPMFMISVVIIRSVILFKRVAIRDKEGFNKMIDRMMARSPVNGLNVYPEGHRSTAEESLPLRRGMLHYAYSRQMPVQIIITAGKEAVISEKDMSAHFGQTLLVGYSEMLHPKDYETPEAFFEAIQKSWSAEWQRVYTFEWRQSLPFRVGEVDYAVHYNFSIKFWSVISQGLSFILFFAYLYATVRCTWWALSLFGSHRSTAAVMLVGWWAASLLDACQTVSPTPKQQAGGTPSPAADVTTNGVAGSGNRGSSVVSRGGSTAIRRGPSNDLASTDISPLT